MALDTILERKNKGRSRRCTI